MNEYLLFYNCKDMYDNPLSLFFQQCSSASVSTSLVTHHVSNAISVAATWKMPCDPRRSPPVPASHIVFVPPPPLPSCSFILELSGAALTTEQRSSHPIPSLLLRVPNRTFVSFLSFLFLPPVYLCDVLSRFERFDEWRLQLQADSGGRFSICTSNPSRL